MSIFANREGLPNLMLVKDAVLVKTVSDTSPTRVTTNTELYFRSARIWGCKAVDGTTKAYTNNNAAISIGGANGINQPISPGESVSYNARPGTKMRLSDLWIRGTAADGVVIEYDEDVTA